MISEIPPSTGVCALVDGKQIAVFRIGDDVYAIGNRDPFTNANVLSLGIVGDQNGVLKVTSPLLKQAFALETGICLDDPKIRVPAYHARNDDGVVEVSATPRRDRLGRLGQPNG